ncbi:MAG: hypothetical protein R2731_06710 [Nocardioides sp.]
MGRLIAARAPALVREGFFLDEAAVARYAGAMKELGRTPTPRCCGPSSRWATTFLDPRIRQVELRNWLRFVDSRPR